VTAAKEGCKFETIKENLVKFLLRFRLLNNNEFYIPADKSVRTLAARTGSRRILHRFVFEAAFLQSLTSVSTPGADRNYNIRLDSTFVVLEVAQIEYFFDVAFRDILVVLGDDTHIRDRPMSSEQGSKYRSKSDCEAKRKLFREKLRSEAKIFFVCA